MSEKGQAAMSGILTDLSPAALAAAIEESHVEFNLFMGRSPRVQRFIESVRHVTGKKARPARGKS